MITIDTGCYNCGSVRSAPFACENGFMLVKCSGCGLLFVTPRPSDAELNKSHECGVHRGESDIDLTGAFNPAKIGPYLSKLNDRYGTELSTGSRTWLDIGCGHGEFLEALKKFSNNRIQVKGIEPNRNKQKSALNRGLDVGYFNLNTHRDQYDVISLLNVFSHLPNPPEFLLLCKKLLKPGGELLLETGDTADLLPEQHHRPFYLPDHLSFASESIVTDILHRCGFEIKAIKKYQSFTSSFGLSAWLKEIVKLMWPRKKSQFQELIKRYRRNRMYIRDMYVRARLP